MRIVGTPHDAIDPDLVAERALGRAQEAGTHPEVALEVLARGQRHLLRYRAEEDRFRGAAMGHAAVEPIERFETARDPARALLSERDAQVGVAFEHAAEGEVPDRTVRVPRELDQHDRSRRLG